MFVGPVIAGKVGAFTLTGNCDEVPLLHADEPATVTYPETALVE